MILLISIIVIIIMYYLLNWLYKEYKNDLENIDEHTLSVSIRLTELERKINMNEQMINALWEEVAEKKLKEVKSKKDKKEGK